MNPYAEIVMYGFAAFAIAVALPAVGTLIAGVIEYLRARRDRHQVEAIVGDWPRVPTTTVITTTKENQQ